MLNKFMESDAFYYLMIGLIAIELIMVGAAGHIVYTEYQQYKYEHSDEYLMREIFGLLPVYDENGEILYWNIDGLPH